MRRTCLVFLPLLTGLLASCPSSAAPAPGTLIDEPCDIEIADDAIAARLRCARLVVLRDPEHPEDGTFELAVVIKRSALPKPGATPVLFLHGGPGGGMTRYLGRSPSDHAPGHDFIAFDMRGGGRSQPQVCAADGAPFMASFLHPDGLDAGIRERRRIVEACRGKWQAAGLRAQHFGTDRNVDDAEALRAALGLQRWRIISESYGTTVAAHYLAKYPEALEAAVLDSLSPKDAEVLPGAEMHGRLIERLADECRQNAACTARWPELGRSWLDTTVAALDAAPLQVGEGDRARLLDGTGLRQMIMQVAGDEAGVRSLPFLIDAAARRDVAQLAGPLSLIGQDESSDGVNLAATLATDCRDRARHLKAHDLSDPMGLLLGVPGDVCRDWAEPAEAPRWPLATRVPVLILSGGYDSFQPDPTPVLREMGPAAQVVEIPHAAHGARGAGLCVRGIASRFISDPAATLDTSCIADMAVPDFLLQATPSRGLRELLPMLVLGATPPPVLIVSVASAGLALFVALVGLWRGRGGPRVPGTRRWLFAPAMAGLIAVGAPASLIASHDSLASAALLYGLPTGWTWLPWISLLPLVIGALALRRGRDGSTRLVAALALACGLAMMAAGWFPGA
ncbi:MAG: alpha/beta hydrolase [Ahniella sp.]|nr:alpha/beta hydrolase [Ahniella sp.]